MAEDTSSKLVASFRVKDFIDVAQMRKDLAYNDTNISDAMMQQASLFAYYGELAAKAAFQVDSFELILENVTAAVYKLTRAKFLADGEKVTEVLLEKTVAQHDQVVAAKKALIESKRVEAVCKSVMEAFRHRRDMLVQTGSTQREELKGELRMSNNNSRDEALKEQKRRVLDTMENLRNS